jgi:AbrB family looped-hinge helix DNA binding protein
MPIIKIGTKHQIVIPSKIFSELDLKVGDFLEAVRNGNNIVLKPMALVPKEEHKKMQSEKKPLPDKSIRKYKEFNNVEDFMENLKS